MIKGKNFEAKFDADLNVTMYQEGKSMFLELPDLISFLKKFNCEVARFYRG